YTIATREGFKNKWMALLPFFNTYYIGVVSDKNKVFKVKAKYISLAAALVEAVYCGLAILYYVAVRLIFSGGYAEPVYETMIYGTQIEMLAGYNLDLLPANLSWAGWVFANMQDYIVYWVQLAYLILKVFILVSFFRTYASPRYLLFSIFSALLPIGGVFMFAVRNNRGKSYVEYIREQQQRQYRMYQEYMRNHGANGQGGTDYGANYGSDNNPYAQPRPSAPPEDPFGGLGSSDGGQKSGGGRSADPFDDFKN
ncbi:MAG: hypothetical protein K2K04_05125, partial [Clostridia bacterium]|nr:hypothetical protein [Clostridia bacterium]